MFNPLFSFYFTSKKYTVDKSTLLPGLQTGLGIYEAALMLFVEDIAKHVNRLGKGRSNVDPRDVFAALDLVLGRFE